MSSGFAMEKTKFELLSEHLNKYPVICAFLFGSEAKGRTTSISDIDIAVSLDKTIPKSERFDLRLKLSGELSAIEKKTVDLVVMNDVPLQLAYEIIKHGKVMFCKDRDERINTELKILSKYLDRRYYDKRRAEIILKRIETEGILRR